MPKNGLRAYLAVKGGFDIAEHLGSSSTVCRELLGGLDAKGSALQVGDVLPFTLTDYHNINQDK